MHLKTGLEFSHNIVVMKNAHTGARYEDIYLHKRINLEGPITKVGTMIKLGYNEEIHCDTEGHALTLFFKIGNFLNG